MAEFRAAKGLEKLAAKLVVDQVTQITRDLRDAARDNAPPSKTWITQGDERVRPEHRKANNQEVPENVRYQVKTPKYDMEHYDPHEYQLLKYPRDEENGTPGNVENCRCFENINPEGVRQNIHFLRAQQKGDKVTGSVNAKFNRIEESEYGANGEPGLRFMGRALQQIAAEHRGR